jgi:hypothetical protein
MTFRVLRTRRSVFARANASTTRSADRLRAIDDKEEAHGSETDTKRSRSPALVGARPPLRRFSEQGLQWVLSAYALTFGGLLLLGGRAADLLGRRRLFMTAPTRSWQRT